MSSYNEMGFASPAVGLRLALRLHNRLSAGIDRQLAGSKPSQTERRIVIELMLFPKQTHRDLATALGMMPGQVSKGVKGLLAEGILTSEQAPRRNQVLLSLSDQGKELAENADAMIDIALSDQFAKLSKEDQENLLGTQIRGAPDAAWVNQHEKVELRAVTSADVTWLLTNLLKAQHQITNREAYASDLMTVLSDYLAQPVYGTPLLALAHRGLERLGICLLRHDDSDIHAHIALLYVVPASRRMGIGTSLLAQALDAAKSLTMTKVTAELTEQQSDLDGLLRKVGFERSRTSRELGQYGFPQTWRDYEYNIPVIS